MGKIAINKMSQWYLIKYKCKYIVYLFILVSSISCKKEKMQITIHGKVIYDRSNVPFQGFELGLIKYWDTGTGHQQEIGRAITNSNGEFQFSVYESLYGLNKFELFLYSIPMNFDYCGADAIYHSEIDNLDGKINRTIVLKPLSKFKLFVRNEFPIDNNDRIYDISLYTHSPCRDDGKYYDGFFHTTSFYGTIVDTLSEERDVFQYNWAKYKYTVIKQGIQTFHFDSIYISEDSAYVDTLYY